MFFQKPGVVSSKPLFPLPSTLRPAYPIGTLRVVGGRGVFLRTPTPLPLPGTLRVVGGRGVGDDASLKRPPSRVLEGSWDLVTRVIIKVTILIITYNPN